MKGMKARRVRNGSYILVLAFCASGQQTPAPKTGARADEHKGASATTATKNNLLVTDSIASVIRRVQASPAGQPKGEFETTEQYNARRTPTDNRVYVFVLERVGGDFEYDADARTMAANLFTKQRTVDPALRTLDIKRMLTARGQYVSQNAFGVKKAISSASYDVFGVAIAVDSSIRLRDETADEDGENGLGLTSFRWKIDLDRAQSLKPHLRLVIAGTVAEPTVFADVQEHSPTITEPWFREYEKNYLLFRLQEIRVVDERSGGVVTKFTSNTAPE